MIVQNVFSNIRIHQLFSLIKAQYRIFKVILYRLQFVYLLIIFNIYLKSTSK